MIPPARRSFRTGSPAYARASWVMAKGPLARRYFVDHHVRARHEVTAICDDYLNVCGRDAERKLGEARHVNVRRWRTVAANCMAGCRPVRRRRRAKRGSPLRRDVGGRNTGGAWLRQRDKSYVDAPCGQEVLKTVLRVGRVRSYVRPVDAAHVTAGLDAVRGSAPNQSVALWCARL